MLACGDYANRVRAMEARRSELTWKYPNKWVSMHNGDVVAIGDSLEAVLADMDALGIPRTGAVVKYLDAERRNLVL